MPSWPPALTERRLQAALSCRGGHPIGAAERATAIHAATHGSQLRFGLRLAVSRLPVVLLPPFDVRVGQLLQERREIPIAFGPEAEMPVVRHEPLTAMGNRITSLRRMRNQRDCHAYGLGETVEDVGAKGPLRL